MIGIEVGCERAGCGVRAVLAFEHAIETFAHLLETLREGGWLVLISEAVVDAAGHPAAVGLQRRTHTFCPSCRATLEELPATWERIATAVSNPSRSDP